MYAYGAAANDDEFSTGEGFAFYNYDGDGNPGYVTGPNGLAMTFAYDEMGRVLQIAGTGASTFRYDGDGRRAERVAGGATTRFAYDGDQAVIETDGGNAVTTYRLPGAGFVTNNVQYYEQESLQGSVLSTRDSSATLKSHTQYDAYGVEYLPWESTPGALGGQRFAGQRGYQNDLATGMQLLGARYYLPALGRFLTPDPIGHEGGLNLYAYCGDSPLLRSDADGTDWNSFSNFMAGLGDHISGSVNAMMMPGLIPQLFFGNTSPTQKFRQIFGYDDHVDTESKDYNNGNIAGWGWDFGMFGAGAIRAWAPKLMTVDEVFAGGQRSADLLRSGGFARNYEINMQDFAAKGFRTETMGKGANAGRGLLMREYGAKGQPTGRFVQFHPGGGRHVVPYVSVRSGRGNFKSYGKGYKP